MKINTRIRYAVRMMADIAKNGEDYPVSLKRVAERQGISKLYLSQLASPLRNASLLKSVWGNKGGYVLARQPGEISLLRIIEAVEGPIGVIDCVLDPECCERSESCEAIGVWRDINAAVTSTLENYTLADLMKHGEPQGREGLVCFGPLTHKESIHDAGPNCP